MKKLWLFLIDGCFHKWFEEGYGDLTYRGRKIGTYYLYKCRKCGKRKQESIY